MNTAFREAIRFIAISMSTLHLLEYKHHNWLHILTNAQLKFGGKNNIFIGINMD